MTNQLLNKNIKALAVCTGFFCLAACKEHSIIKDNLTDVDNITTFAMQTGDFDINFTIGSFDSLATSNFMFSGNPSSAVSSAVAIGAFTDPFFGQTQSIAHFQLTPYSSDFRFPQGAILDSAVLVMPFKRSDAIGGVYGDTLSEIHWNIYKTGEALDRNKTYYSNNQTALGELIGKASFKYSDYKPNSQQIIAATNDTTQGQLRIKLNSDFAQEMFAADTSVYRSTTAFQSFFNGISIAPDLTKNQNLLNFFLLPTPGFDQKNLSAARIEFHYHTDDTTRAFSSLVVRPSVCAYYSNLTTSYLGFPAEGLLGSTIDSVLVQGQPGYYTDVTIKGLSRIPLSAINKAELVITAANPGTGLEYLTAPGVLLPVLVDENGREQNLYERLDNSGSINSSGIYLINPYAKRVSINGVDYSQYRVNIPRSIQKYILDGKDEITIRIKTTNENPGFFRIVAPGVVNSQQTPNFEFNIIYTKQ